MRLTIHRGCHEIGGTCIELSHTGSTLLLDVGLPLRADSRPINVAAMRPDAILISHGHQDHVGMLDSVDASIPVLISKVAKALIDVTRLFTRQELPANTFKHFIAWEPFCVGSFTITPYLVDHSGPDAYAFLIDGGDQRLLYTGDFRAHGRKSCLFARIVREPPADIDVLIMEGTMMRRTNLEFPSESAVEDAICAVIHNQQNISFLVCSSQNIDRIVSAYRACLRSGKRLVVDLYTAWVLEQLKLVSNRVPSMAWDHVEVYIPGSQYEVLKDHRDHFGEFAQRVFKQRVRREELQANPTDYLYLVRMAAGAIIEQFRSDQAVNIIYSQWQGYLDGCGTQLYGAREMAALRDADWVNFVFAHTSGHAVLDDLKLFAKALNPRMLVPVHTEHSGDYAQHFDNVVTLKDGAVLDI